MLSVRRLALTAALTLAVSPVAFAQDYATDSAYADTAAGKRVSIVAGYSTSEPTKNPEIAGARTDLKGEGTPTVGVTYHITDNIGIEAWAADRIGHRIDAPGGQKLGSVDATPYSVSGQYRFGAADTLIRPFVGLGYHETNFNEETVQAGGPLAGQRLGINTTKGAVATLGMDVNISPTWFARADARYFQGESDIRLNGTKVGDAELNPVMVSVGVGARF